MKKIAWIVVVAVFCLYPGAYADEMNIEVSTETQVDTLVVWGGNSDSDFINRSQGLPFSGAAIPLEPPGLMNPREFRNIWREVPVFRHNSLLRNKAGILAKAADLGIITQNDLVAIRLPPNQGDVEVLGAFPDNREMLYFVAGETPLAAPLLPSIRLLVSLVKEETNSTAVAIITTQYIEGRAASNTFAPGGAAGGYIDHAISYSLGSGINAGKSASRPFNGWFIEIYGYGPATRAPAAPSPAGPTAKFSSALGDNGIEEIDQLRNWVGQNIGLVQNGLVSLEVFHLPGIQSETIENRIGLVMRQIDGISNGRLGQTPAEKAARFRYNIKEAGNIDSAKLRQANVLAGINISIN